MKMKCSFLLRNVSFYMLVFMHGGEKCMRSECFKEINKNLDCFDDEQLMLISSIICAIKKKKKILNLIYEIAMRT